MSDVPAASDRIVRASGHGRRTGRPLGPVEAEHAAGSGSFLRSRWVDVPAGTEEIDPAELAPGFVAGAVSCGLKPSGQTDVALLACEAERIDSSLLLTRNAAAAAPVRVCRDECDRRAIRAAVVNSGNANAATGGRGYRDALAMRDAAARELGVDPRSVAVAETGTIGVPLPLGQVVAGIAAAAGRLDASGGRSFAEAIMTTDAAPKLCAARCDGVTISAQAKGGGMIEPGLATMLCFVQTDAVLPEADAALRAAAADSFERITVDGQMSTNDTLLLQGTGASGRALPDGLLEAVLLQLALAVVADGEGATRVGRIEVTGAADDEQAERTARAIANSPLVQTALHGRDPNWGRIVQAAGMALAGTELPDLGSEAVEAEELGADSSEARIALRLPWGAGTAHVYFSDLTAEYVRINSEYVT